MTDSDAIPKSRRGTFRLPIIAAACFAAATATLNIATADDPCEPSWLNAISQPWLNDSVNAIAVFDDGSGPAMFVGGEFTQAGVVPDDYFVKWDGTPAGMSAVAGGPDGPVHALTVFDDGTGPALYVGGEFNTAGGVPAKRIAKWDGQQWSALGTGTDTTFFPRVLSLAVYDDGSGPALYASASYIIAGGDLILGIAKWDGQQWSPLGSGITGGTEPSIMDLAVFDDGSGPALFATGKFSSAGGSSVNLIAKWDGQQWSALGSGIGGAGGQTHVRALCVFDDGTGPGLYAGGEFTTAGGVAANYVARWDGQQWSPLGNGVSWKVVSLTVYDDGTGSALHAGGYFTTAGGMPADLNARWDGQHWSAVGLIQDGDYLGAEALTVFDDGFSPAVYGSVGLYLGGEFMGYCITRWDGKSLSGGPNSEISLVDAGLYPARALVEFDDGTGSALYVGGRFETAGGQIVNNVARWQGPTIGWIALANGLNGWVEVLVVFDDGSGPALYAGGWFTAADGVTLNRVAKWDGFQWSPLGTGLNGTVSDLVVFDDGSGPALYAGGEFTAAGEMGAAYIAKWDGQQWSELGFGMNDPVRSLAVFDDGSGPALYAGGDFRIAGGVNANHIVRWDGQQLSSLATGLEGDGLQPTVQALKVFDDGSGPALYVGGEFQFADELQVNNIARWDGLQWSALGNGTSGPTPNVLDLEIYDDGSGPALYAGGTFLGAGSVIASRIAKWDGQEWSALSLGINSGAVVSMEVFDYGSGPGLYVGGGFYKADGRPAASLANWGGCPVTIAGDFDADSDVDGADFATFTQCLAGPAVPPAGTCPIDADADLDTDGDVDLQDFADFQTYFTGP